MLILDFDGVIADSAYECFVVTSRMRRLRGLEVDYQLFKRYRYLVNEPFGFPILLRLLSVGELDIVHAYQQEYLEKSPSERATLNQEFFSERASLIRDLGINRWISLNPSTLFFNELLKTDRNSNCVAIVSTKDESALKTWFSQNCPGVSRIFGNNAYRDYGDKFSLIANEFSLREEKIFIDDNQEHIDDYDWDSINCEAHLARWGYNMFDDDNSLELLRLIS